MKHKLSASFDDIATDRRFVPANLPKLADRLASVIARLEDWQIRVADFGRLRESERLLRSIATAGHYSDDVLELRRSAEAIRVAQDFGQIADAVQPAELKRISSELQHALKGTLAADDGTRRPFQFQTQFWFGAALSRAVLNPIVPPLSVGTHPDFVVRPYALEYGVEVKRPVGRKGAFAALEQARSQLSDSGYHGVIAIDLSDCLDDLGLRLVVQTAKDRAHESLVEPYRDLCQRLVDVAWNEEERQHKPRFSHLMGLWLYARGWRWVRDNLDMPQMFEMQGFQSMASRKGNVWQRAADDFFARMVRSLQSGGFHIFAADHESYDPIVKPFWSQ